MVDPLRNNPVPPKSPIIKIPETVTFQVESKNPSKQVSQRKMWQIILINCVSLGLVPVFNSLSRKLAARILLHRRSESKKIEADAFKKAFLKNHSDISLPFNLNIADEAKIDGVAIFSNKDNLENFKAKENCADQKWVVFFCGNAMQYESMLNFAKEYSEEVDANVLLFNYRGVGRSKGDLHGPEDLISDGNACMQFIQSRDIPEKNIVLHGYSIGGAIAAQVSSKHEKSPIVSVNSFSSLSKEVEELIPVIGKVVKLILLNIGWELDSIKALEGNKAKKLIIYHKLDGIVPYKASVRKALKNKNVKDEQTTFFKQNVGRTIGSVKLAEPPWNGVTVPLFRTSPSKKISEKEKIEKIQYLKDLSEFVNLIPSIQQKLRNHCHWIFPSLGHVLSAKGWAIEADTSPLNVYLQDVNNFGASALTKDFLLNRYETMIEELGKAIEHLEPRGDKFKDLQDSIRGLIEETKAKKEALENRAPLTDIGHYPITKITEKKDWHYHLIIQKQKAEPEVWIKINEFVKKQLYPQVT